MKLVLIRHGSTAWNKEKRAQGSADIPLDEQGLSDAEKLAERLKKEEWDALYASPLKRARQTADAISKLTDLEIVEDDRIREVSGGQIEGTTEEERIEKWGNDWRQLELGIEKPEVVLNRAHPFLEELVSRHNGQKVIVVSHGGWIAILVNKLLNGIESTYLDNTSVTELEFSDDGNWICVRFNCTRHVNQVSQ